MANEIGNNLNMEKHNSYQNLETIVNQGLRLALMEPMPDDSIAVELEYIGKALQGERTYIFEKNENGGDDNTYEWTAEGVTPEKENLQNLPPEVCANWYDIFTENKIVVIEDLEDIKENDPLQYENLKRQNITSLIVVPLYENDRAIGFYGVDNPPREYFDYATNMLQIMGHFIMSTLKRRNLMRKLELMSFRDQLTELGNRYAMHAFLDKETQNCEQIGVVYCDIMGLKRVNDREGHKAGDDYIVRASRSLEKAFKGFGLFRIGGDELLAICPGIEQTDLEKRVGLFKQYLKESSVGMATGAVYKSGSFDIDSVIREAEILMYEDKEQQYRKEGNDRRHR